LICSRREEEAEMINLTQRSFCERQKRKFHLLLFRLAITRVYEKDENGRWFSLFSSFISGQ